MNALKYEEIMKYIEYIEIKIGLKKGTSVIYLYTDGSWMIKTFGLKVVSSGKTIETLIQKIEAFKNRN